MNRDEHLLTIAAEECMEIALDAAATGQRLTKALRFGLDEVQPGQAASNRERILEGYGRLAKEFNEFRAVLSMIGLINADFPTHDLEAIHEKREKVERFLAYSAECGTLT